MINTEIKTLGELVQFLADAKDTGYDDNTPILFGGAGGGVSVRCEDINATPFLAIDEQGYDPNND